MVEGRRRKGSTSRKKKEDKRQQEIEQCFEDAKLDENKRKKVLPKALPHRVDGTNRSTKVEQYVRAKEEGQVQPAQET